MIGGKPIVHDRFMGLYDRGIEDSVPLRHFSICKNIDFSEDLLRTRKGFEVLETNNAYSFKEYMLAGMARSYLYSNLGGDIFENRTRTLINEGGSIRGNREFSIATAFNRIYLSRHNGLSGEPGAGLQVYLGDGQASRNAAGAPPEGAMAVSQSTGGLVEGGHRIFAVAYETESGHVTRLGSYVYHNVSDDASITLNNIPTGPSHITKRHVYATKVLQNFDANVDFRIFTYFRIPSETINDNTTTSATLSFLDASLIENADRIQDSLEEIPAGIALTTSDNRLFVGGENVNPDILRISDPGQPERFNAVDGFIEVGKGLGGGIRNVIEYRGQIFVFKDNLTYSITPDPTRAPAFWDAPILVDAALGAHINQVSKFSQSDGSTEDILLVANEKGIVLFDGTFKNRLTVKIDNLWREKFTRDSKNSLVIDTVTESIYFKLNDDNILYGSYAFGMKPDTIRWSVWELGDNVPVHMGLINRNLVYSYGEGNVAEYKPLQSEPYRDFNTEFETDLEVSKISSPNLSKVQAKAVRVRLGNGRGTFFVYVNDQLVMRDSFAHSQLDNYQYLCNILADSFNVRLTTNGVISLEKLILFYQDFWQGVI